MNLLKTYNLIPYHRFQLTITFVLAPEPVRAPVPPPAAPVAAPAVVKYVAIYDYTAADDDEVILYNFILFLLIYPS